MDEFLKKSLYFFFMHQVYTDMKKSRAEQTLRTPAASLRTFTSASSAHAGYCGTPKGPVVGL